MSYPEAQCCSPLPAESLPPLDLARSRLILMPISRKKIDSAPAVRSWSGNNHDPAVEGDVARMIPTSSLAQQLVDTSCLPIKPAQGPLRGRSSGLGHARDFVGTAVDHGPARTKGSDSPVLKTIATRICIPNSSGGSPSPSSINQR